MKSSAPPTLSQFAADSSCSLYNAATSIRVRIRAPDAALACRLVPRRFPASSRLAWTTTKPHDFRTTGDNRRYATLCRLAAPRARYVLEVNAPTGTFTRGHLLCAEGAAQRGWLDLDRRLTAFDVGAQGADSRLLLQRRVDVGLRAECDRGEERRARPRLQQESCVRQVVFVPKAVGAWLLEKEKGIPPIFPNPLPDELAIVPQEPSCVPRLAAAVRAAHLPGVQAVRFRRR